MQFERPNDEKLSIRTDRLILEPILKSHAKEMVELLSDPKLYTYIRQNPQDLAKLEEVYEFWSKRLSPNKDEIWLNWAARLISSGEIVGHFQAGIKNGPDSHVAYIIGANFQKQGFAKEGLQTVLSFLNSEFDLTSVKAWIDTRNIASIKLVERLGMKRIQTIKDADHFKGAPSDEFVYQMLFES